MTTIMESVDVDNLTPRDALNLIYTLKERLNEQESS